MALAVLTLVAQAHLRTSSSPSAAGHMLRAEPRLRLVINSHVDYRSTLAVLLQSLQDAHFQHFNETIVVMGGAPQAAAPARGDLGITFANVTTNGYDFNGLAALEQYADSPLVRATAYLYIHDTCTVSPSFPRKFAALDVGPGDLLQPPRPNANIRAFGRDVLQRTGTTFMRDFTKEEPLKWERHGKPHLDFEQFATHVVALHHRIDEHKEVDRYNTGHKRRTFYYDDLGVYKYVFWGKHGDILVKGGKMDKVVCDEPKFC